MRLIEDLLAEEDVRCIVLKDGSEALIEIPLWPGGDAANTSRPLAAARALARLESEYTVEIVRGTWSRE